jgi:hypothetical protein
MLFFAAHGVHFPAPAKKTLRQHGTLRVGRSGSVGNEGTIVVVCAA